MQYSGNIRRIGAPFPVSLCEQYKGITDRFPILRRFEYLAVDIAPVPLLRSKPEHAMVVFFAERKEQICPPAFRALDDYGAEMADIPFPLAPGSIEKIVVFPQLPEDRRFAVAVVAYFRPLNFQEEMVGIFPFRPSRIGDREIRVGMDRRGLEIRPLPVEPPSLLLAEILHGNVEPGDFKLVVERAGGVLVEGFGHRDAVAQGCVKPSDSAVREPVDMADGTPLPVKLDKRLAVEQSFLPQEMERAPRSAEVVFIRFVIAEELCQIIDAQTEVFSEKCETFSLFCRETERSLCRSH